MSAEKETNRYDESCPFCWTHGSVRDSLAETKCMECSTTLSTLQWDDLNSRIRQKIAREREECAMVAESSGLTPAGGAVCAAAIRARKDTP